MTESGTGPIGIVVHIYTTTCTAFDNPIAPRPTVVVASSLSRVHLKNYIKDNFVQLIPMMCDAIYFNFIIVKSIV
jgi:hypothetical protein